MQHTLNSKKLTPANWRQEVYEFQRAGKMDASFRQTARAFGKGSKVRLANPDIPDERRLIDHVLDGCEFHGITNIPPVAILDTRIVNAASVGGRGIFFTTGIMRTMPDEQIRAVVGHELGHHRHVLRDMPVLLALEGVIELAIYEMNLSTRSLWQKVIKTRPGTAGSYATMFGALATDLMAISTIFTPWRWFMELDSDKDGAKFGGSRQMGDALETLKRVGSELKEKRELTVLQKIGKAAAKVMGFIVSPWGSHPPTDWRISRMREGKQYPGMLPAAGGEPHPLPPMMHGLPRPNIRADEAQHAATIAPEQEQQIVA